MFEWETVYFQLLSYLEQPDQNIKPLFGLLRHHQENFTKLLDAKPPRKEDRDKINKKDPIKQTEPYKRIAEKVTEITKLSDALKLNELEVVELFVKVDPISEAADLYKNAKELYFRNRSFMLFALLTILNVAFDLTKSLELRVPLGNFVSTLFDDNLIEKVLKTIEANMSNKDPDLASLIVAEQSTLSNILFTIFYASPTNVKAVRQLLTLIQKGSESFAPDRKKLSNEQAAKDPNFALLSSLTMSFVAAIHLAGEGLQMDDVEYTKMSEDLKKMVTEGKWGIPDFNSIISFTWGMYTFNFGARNENDLIKKSIDKGVFEHLTVMMQNFDYYPAETVLSLYYELLFSFLDFFLRSQAPLIREMKRGGEMAHEENMSNESFENQDAFKNLLVFISRLCKRYPANLEQFWTDNSLKEFVRTSESSYSFPLYIEMLSSLASSPRSSYPTFLYLKDTNSPEMNWNSFFSWMQNLLGTFSSSTHKEISDNERDLLVSILHVIRAVVENDDRARTSLYTSRIWKPLEILFHLLACPLSPTLKGETLATIQAFAHSQELVPQIWQHIDAIISSPEGIQKELLLIEVKYQVYPYLTSYLDIMQFLISAKFPDDLPLDKNSGIFAHLKFIIDDVILRFHNRSYINEGDKWIIGSKALGIVLALLEKYSVSEADFEKQYKNTKEKKLLVPKPVGFELMRKLLLNADPLLIAIMRNITDGENTLAIQGHNDPNQIKLVENCLQIVHCLLEKQNQFVEFNRKSKSPIPNLVPFQHHPELTSWIASLTFYLRMQQNHKMQLLTVNIYYLVSRYERMQVVMTGTIYQIASIRKQFIDGITCCLETLKVEDSLLDEHQIGEFNADTSIRMAVLRLLLSSLEYQPPKNLAFLSLGFDINRTIDSNDLKETSRNPLNTMLNILKSGATQNEPKLAEQCYKFIYKLCKTTMTMMFYIRSNQFDLFAYQIPLLNNFDRNDEDFAAQLQWRAWFLRLVSLDIFLSAKQSNSHKQHIKNLFTVSNESLRSNDDDDMTPENRMIMRSLLDFLDAPVVAPPQISPYIQGVNALLDAANLGKPGECTTLNEYDLLEYDTKNVHQKLIAAENLLMNRGGSGSYTAAKMEILRSVAARQSYVLKTTAVCEFINAWRQTVFATLEQFNVLNDQERENILLELLEGLLGKMKHDIHPPALQIISASVLLLMQKLNEQKVGHYATKNQGKSSNRGISKDLPVDRLTEIFRGVNDAILRCGSVIGIVRSNLYLAFIDYIHFTQRPNHHIDANASISMEEEMQLTSVHNQWSRLEQENVRILESSGPQLIQIIAKDADSGVHLNRSAAFSLLDLLMRYDSYHNFLSFIDRQGYLQNFITDFARQDSFLQELVKPGGPKVTTELLVYTSKMSFLVSVAESGSADSLIDNRLIEQLHDCGFIDLIPDSSSQNEEGMRLYHQIVGPLLQLLAAILNALSTSPVATSQISIFIQNHFELFSMSLRENVVTLEGLKKLELVTRIFLLTLRSNVERNNKMDKFNAILVSLLSKYSAVESGLPQIQPQSDMELQASHQPALLFSKKTVFSELVRKEVRQLARNLSLVCRYLCFNLRTPFSIVKLPTLFSHSLAQTTDESNASSLPPVYELIKLLKNTLMGVDNATEDLKTISKKIAQIPDLPGNQLMELILQPSEEIEHFDKTDKQNLVFLSLTELQQEREKALRDYAIIIDNTLLLLWIHLAKFLSRQDRPQENVLLAKGKQNVPINLDGKQRKLFRQKATDLLITHPNNMLDKIEALSICGSDSNVQFITRKIRELLKQQGDS